MVSCIYCNAELGKGSVVDVCSKCGYSVWGEKMFLAIKENMKNASDSGDLNQGSITDSINLAEDFSV